MNYVPKYPQYWLNIMGCGWLEVTLLEYQKTERSARLTNARLAGAPDLYSFCYTNKQGETTKGRILKEDGEHYKWDPEFQAALKKAA